MAGVEYTNPPQSRNEAIVESIIEGTQYTDPPQSENEEILVSILNDTPYEKPPRSRFADLLLKLKEFIGGGGGGRPKVPQTGTWQFKTTPTKGFIILGHDDDTADSAQFVRMAYGHNFPVVLNTEADDKTHLVSADTDNEYYPSETVSAFPDGGTVEQLNKWVLANNAGEVAQHDTAIGQTWMSSKLIGEALDTIYATYTSGGGTKTKTELKEAIMEKYGFTDLDQGAPRVAEQRALIEESIEDYVYTIGKWGGHQTWVIDDIDLGHPPSGVEVGTNTDGWSRKQNYMGDGSLTSSIDWNAQRDPWHIWRNSSGALEANIGDMCQIAYENSVCIECFYHQFLTDASKWLDMKNAFNILQNWVNQGKIQVVTRKQYYTFGEFVEHPITSLNLTTAKLVYEVGDTISEADFTCKAVLDNGTIIDCASDKILDYSNVDTSTAGTYTATLRYRGLKTSCTITVSGTAPTNYLVENASFSGESMSRGNDYGDLTESITYEANKTYKIEFDFVAATSVSYSTHWIQFQVADYKMNWISNQTVGQIDSVEGTTSGHVVIEFTTSASKTVTKFVRDAGEQHTTIGEWSITNGYIYEVPEET